MAERLKASGVRSINNFVDITNFVMLEYGNPMHAFDLRYVEGGKINVRNAQQGEKITILDGSEVTLSPEMLIIADEKKPIAVAGVMGGEFSGIMDDTNTVVFEAACFDGVSVRMTAKKINKRTDASSRFEKGIDPINSKAALMRALELVEELGCGEVVREYIDVDNAKKVPHTLKLDTDWINEHLGTNIPAEEQIAIFKKLGFGYENGSVIVPNTRVVSSASATSQRKLRESTVIMRFRPRFRCFRPLERSHPASTLKIRWLTACSLRASMKPCRSALFHHVPMKSCVSAMI